MSHCGKTFIRKERELKKAKEFKIDLIPDWYKALSKDEDRIE